mmetsp:Transcript_20247/g.53976  ORF Transcript_20247/g.53976 Transcript_20247/m.53976 type:complete len:99 (+) Transcript_20247:178-474(+)
MHKSGSFFFGFLGFKELQAVVGYLAICNPSHRRLQLVTYLTPNCSFLNSTNAKTLAHILCLRKKPIHKEQQGTHNPSTHLNIFLLFILRGRHDHGACS